MNKPPGKKPTPKLARSKPTPKPRTKRPRAAVKKTPRNPAPAAVPTAEDEALLQAFRMMESARQSLLATEAKLRVIMRDSTDPAEQAQASLELLQNAREQQLLEARRLALENGSATLRPPSAGDIAESQRLAAALAQVLAANPKVAAIVALTADIVRLIEKLVA